ncbi:vesicle transport protein SFT2B isoform X2 [Hippoglossus stenolepis]|uniref:vesicle transport protein SFT2B isoform X2 n=1 Tax=Hippoglossus stenolepis TaxID=195615 RepID=UPI00159C1ABB|nr:vesicle transport protein SFT2B isoform X2 [Hippoglossus stenolepis]
MDKLKKVLSGQEEGGDPEGPGALERANQAVTLGWGRRVKGFLVCFILGAFMSLLATFMLWIPGFGLAVFVVFYTVGNISILASVMFLVGPWRQLRTMCARERALATFLVLWTNFTLALIFCLLQVLAFIWYGLSYLPFAREGVLKFCSICCS